MSRENSKGFHPTYNYGSWSGVKAEKAATVSLRYNYK